MSAKKGWNIISRGPQEKTRISLEDVHYGPISAGESELKLLGNVKGKNALEIGCGGGQNAIVLAKWGAKSVGLDISEEQIKHARKLARKERVTVPFHVGNMEDLSMFNNGSFDIVLSSFAIDYVDNPARTFREAFRVLRKGGLSVFAVVHPMINRGRVMRFGKRRVWAVSNYFDKKTRMWTWKIEDKRLARFRGDHRTFQDYFDFLLGARFVVEKVLEPEPYRIDRMSVSEREKLPYLHEYYVKHYDLLKRIPYTLIFKARRPKD
jgi:ubiquinone/menaquinone biosynthesis C-methylase UbiE